MPRHPKHDYKSPCIYHITIRKISSVPDFSKVAGTIDSWSLSPSPLGECILTSISTISDFNASLRMLQYVIMPDHVHMLIRVLEYLDRPIGVYIGKLKVRALQTARFRNVYDTSLFEADFHDRFLRPFHSLDIIYQYIRQNPYRLLVRKCFPHYFRMVSRLFSYRGIQWHAYGNLQLYYNPFKDAVVCHRRDAGFKSVEKAHHDSWMHTASNGGVLISAFISPKEKDIRREAEEIGGKIILISNEAFHERYKPSGKNFDLCEQGRLMILAPDRDLPDCRQTFLLLNEVAESIASGRIF